VSARPLTSMRPWIKVAGKPRSRSIRSRPPGRGIRRGPVVRDEGGKHAPGLAVVLVGMGRNAPAPIETWWVYQSCQAHAALSRTGVGIGHQPGKGRHDPVGVPSVTDTGLFSVTGQTVPWLRERDGEWQEQCRPEPVPPRALGGGVCAGTGWGWWFGWGIGMAFSVAGMRTGYESIPADLRREYACPGRKWPVTILARPIRPLRSQTLGFAVGREPGRRVPGRRRG